MHAVQDRDLASRLGCPDCGVVAVLHGRRKVWVRDLPADGRPVALLWSKRVWRCEEPPCERGSWTKRSSGSGSPERRTGTPTAPVLVLIAVVSPIVTERFRRFAVRHRSRFEIAG